MVNGIVKAISHLENMKTTGYHDIFNISTGVPHTLTDVIDAISDCLDKNLEVTYSESRKCDVQRFVGDTEKARRVLGFEAKVPLNKGISMTVDLYQRSFDYFSQNDLRTKELTYQSLYEGAF
jgi:UDP-glucose 4-epimerase